MATPQEVEIKFLVSDLKALEQKLRELGFREETPSTHEVNTLYDLPGQKLRRKGELLRLRDYGGKWRLTHKAKVKARKAQVTRRIGDWCLRRQTDGCDAARAGLFAVVRL